MSAHTVQFVIQNTSQYLFDHFGLLQIGGVCLLGGISFTKSDVSTLLLKPALPQLDPMVGRARHKNSRRIMKRKETRKGSQETKTIWRIPRT